MVRGGGGVLISAPGAEIKICQFNCGHPEIGARHFDFTNKRATKDN